MLYITNLYETQTSFVNQALYSRVAIIGISSLKEKFKYLGKINWCTINVQWTSGNTSSYGRLIFREDFFFGGVGWVALLLERFFCLRCWDLHIWGGGGGVFSGWGYFINAFLGVVYLGSKWSKSWIFNSFVSWDK